MDEEFLDNFFIALNKKIDNKRYTRELRENINNLDEDTLKELIENHF